MAPMTGPIEITRRLLQELRYSRPKVSRDPSLEDGAYAMIAGWNLSGSVHGLERMLPTALTFIEFCYPHHPFDLKLLHVIITAFAFWIDDTVEENYQACVEFQGRFHSRQAQLHPALDCLGALLGRIYEYYEPFVADQMLVSALRFPGNCILELESSKQRGFRLSKHATLYADFIRAPAAVTEYYAYAAFDRVSHPTVLEYIQAIPPLVAFLNLANDVISAHKEELVGEDHNYITFQSQVQGRGKLEVLNDAKAMAVSAHEQVTLILAFNAAPFNTWKHFSMAYLTFHTEFERFALPQDIAMDGVSSNGPLQRNGLSNGSAHMNELSNGCVHMNGGYINGVAKSTPEKEQ